MWTNPNQNKQTNTKTNKTRHWIKSREIQGLWLWTIRNCWNSASGHDLAVALMSPHPGAPAVVGVVDLSLGKVLVSATLWSLSTGKHKRPVTHRGNSWHLKSNVSGVLSDPLILPNSLCLICESEQLSIEHLILKQHLNMPCPPDDRALSMMHKPCDKPTPQKS